LLSHLSTRSGKELGQPAGPVSAAEIAGRRVRCNAEALWSNPVPDAVARAVHTDFRDFVLDPSFSCLGAKAAINRDQYRLGVYGAMAEAETTVALAADLMTFIAAWPDPNNVFTTFVASFVDTSIESEEQFERLLWRQLQQLDDIDNNRHAWDPTVSADPTSPTFSYSFGGRAFFVVGLHPHSRRLSRRFRWPALVFNPHAQFEELKRQGSYGKLQAAIRAREALLQGDINDLLHDFGQKSEARQYAGRAVGPDWHCPFQSGERAPSDL